MGNLMKTFIVSISRDDAVVHRIVVQARSSIDALLLSANLYRLPDEAPFRCAGSVKSVSYCPDGSDRKLVDLRLP